jgi:hypothetical protein
MITLDKISDSFYLLKFGEMPVAALFVDNEKAKLHIVAAESLDVKVTKLS